MEKNKKFELPELTVVLFGKDDIITESSYSPYDPEKDYWQE